MEHSSSTVREKAIQINSSDFIYGTVAEIGAGQETARWFFRTRGASNTLAKAMSAYDMQFSDAIYGAEDSGRYVCESRLKKMLGHEYSLLVERLDSHKGEQSCFFAFSNTVAARSRRTGSQGHGWLGVRWQSSPRSEPNEVRIHVKMLDERNIQQQEALGIMGINLIYAAFFFSDHPYKIIDILGEDLEEGRIQVDYIHIEGPSVKEHDKRILNLRLVHGGLTDAVAFTPQGEPIQPTEFLYGKSIYHFRGHFKPINNHHFELMECAQKEIENYKSLEFKLDKDRTFYLAEIEIENFQSESGQTLLEEEFLQRHELIKACEIPLLVTNIPKYFHLQKFFEDNKVKHSFLIVEIDRLNRIMSDDNFSDLRGGLLEGIGNLLRPSTFLLVCPTVIDGNVVDALNFSKGKSFENLFDYLLGQHRIIPTKCLNEENLQIKSNYLVEKIKANDDSWTKEVPEKIVPLIKNNKMFQ